MREFHDHLKNVKRMWQKEGFLKGNIPTFDANLKEIITIFRIR